MKQAAGQPEVCLPAGEGRAVATAAWPSISTQGPKGNPAGNFSLVLPPKSTPLRGQSKRKREIIVHLYTYVVKYMTHINVGGKEKKIEADPLNNFISE